MGFFGFWGVVRFFWVFDNFFLKEEYEVVYNGEQHR